MDLSSDDSVSDSGSDGTDAMEVAVIVGVLLVTRRRSEQRQLPHVRRRIAWIDESERLLREGQFRYVYRMDTSSFDRLCALIAPRLDRRPHSWGVRGAITLQNKVQMTVRYLSGGAMQDIRRVGGVSKAAFYTIVHQVIGAIRATEQLQIVFPMSATERERAALEFRTLSEHDVMRGCIGALDGWLCSISAPPESNDGPGPRTYYSGHYSRMGINVQACVDSRSRFTFVNCDHPGGVNDSRAYQESSLSSIIEGVERGLYVVADNAYQCTNKILTPFTGAQVGGDRYKDAYNFYLSQLRIRVEMAFGLLVAKWSIFDRPLTTNLPNTVAIIHAAMMLHNFIVDERLALSEDPVHDDMTQSVNDSAVRGMNGLLGYTSSDTAVLTRGVSFVRDGIVRRLRDEGILRPYQP